jgi:UPF0271 protein
VAILLNCDMGESYGVWGMGNDEALFPHIDMANLACGFHASDPININKSVALAKEHNVQIGAHVSYHDLVGFGRRSIPCTPNEITAKVVYQIGALYGFCKSHNVTIEYVKPHGALYNDMMKDITIYEAILKAISDFDSTIKLMLLSTLQMEVFETLAKQYSIELLYETFADRNYTDEGFLVPRNQSNAVIHDDTIVIKRIAQLQTNNTIYSINNQPLQLKTNTICIHGDNPNALEFVQKIKQHLQ